MIDLKTTWPQNIKPQAQSPSEQGEGTVALVMPRRLVPRAWLTLQGASEHQVAQDQLSSLETNWSCDSGLSK